MSKVWQVATSKGIVRQRKPAGVTLVEGDGVGDDLREGAAEMFWRLGDPASLAVHPGEAGGRPQIRKEQARPVAEAATDVRQG
jgi:hypothetical protein